MGQIIGGAARPKRCNISRLSQLGTPAAGEYILVSSDNSMNAAGQGNFDCYIVGDGTTAATALELKSLAEITLNPESMNSVSGKAFADVLFTKVVDGEISISDNYTFTTSNYISASSGKAVSANTTWRATLDFIPITNWYSVVIGSTGGTSSAAAVAFYSSNSESSFISSSPCATPTTVQVPSEAKYARFSKANTNDCHTVNTFQLVSKFASIEEQVTILSNDLNSNYEKKAIETDYLPQVITGKAYKSGGIGSAIVSTSNSSFSYVKVPCKKGDIFGIITTGHMNAHACVVTDANDIVLYSTSYSSYTIGGVFEVFNDTAAYLYVSGYGTNAIQKISKLAFSPNDTIVVDGVYANTALYSINEGANYQYTGYAGITIPLLFRDGDVAKINFKSNLNYRGYILRNLDNTVRSYISDTDLGAELLLCNNTGEDLLLSVTGTTAEPPYIIRYSKDVAYAMKHYGKKMVALGDSITSYAASDVGEIVRGELGVSFLEEGTAFDWGNLAEGNATICNFENTTPTLTHNSDAISGTYVNRTLPNEVLQLLQHITTEGGQISWHINSDNSDHSLATSVGTGAGYTDDIPDLIYIAMGTNDTVTTDDFDEVIAQTYSQLTKLTICSALRWCLETLQNVFPKATIVCVTPIKRGTRSIAEMEAKCALIKKICNYMAIPVVDGYNISGYSPLSYGLYSSDTIHPNTNTQRIAKSIAAQVDALC